MKRIFIVGGGSSLTGFRFDKLNNVDCITINRSLFDVPSPKYFITIDHSFLFKIKNKNERKIFNRTKATKFFAANFGSGQLQYRDGAVFCTKTKKKYDLSAFDIVIKSMEVGGLGFDWKDFKTGNCSGFCAMQLAVLLGYRKICLLGIDLVASEAGAVHYHNAPGYNPAKTLRALDEYFNYFAAGIKVANKRGVDVISCSGISRLNQIIPYEKPSNLI